MRAILLMGLLAGCGHIAPVVTEGVPPPWPAPDAPVVQRATPVLPAPAEPKARPVVPPLKREVAPPPAVPNTPQ
jgi:hypothetical protein